MKRVASALLALLLVLTMVAPNLVGPVWAAARSSRGSQDEITERPTNYDLFFDSENEAYSFNTATYWDVYQQNLGVTKGSTQLGSNTENFGLVLTSSTDGALVPKSGSSVQAVDDNLENTGAWGAFQQGSFAEGQKTLVFQGLTLSEGNNNITVTFAGNGPDVRALRLKDGSGNVVLTMMPQEGVNVQSALQSNAEGTYGSNQTVTDKNNSWVESLGTATFKSGEGCFGWLSNNSVVYHLVNTGLAAGMYTAEVEYAWGGDASTTRATASVNNGGGSLGGALRIDYESADTFRYQQYSADGNASYTNFDYSDGSSTVVGWGGDFQYDTGKDAKYLAVAVKHIEGPELDTVLDYLTIHLVDQSGTTIDTLRRNKIVRQYVGSNSFNAECTTYVYGPIASPASAESDVQGIKIMFERGNNEQDISGSVELYYVGICTSENELSDDRTNWIDFCPFNYNGATLNGYEENGTRPYLRPNANSERHTVNVSKPGYTNEKGESTNKNAVVSGYNVSVLSHYDWHAWTMSTSDANIVSEANASNNGTGTFNALEIKYRNTDSHTTYARLTGPDSRIRKGQWLAITMKAEDLEAMKGTSQEDIDKIQIVLKKGDTEVRRAFLDEFRTACTDQAPKINLEELKLGYRTLFLNMGNDTEITTVEFDFSQVEKAGTGEDTHRIYVKDIYLFDPALTIDKSVDLAQAEPGDTLTYTLTIENPYTVMYDNDFAVTDTLPEGLTYIPESTTITGPDGDLTAEPIVQDRTLTWNITKDLQPGEKVTIRFQAIVDENAVDGTVYRNKAAVAGIFSNDAVTTVSDNAKLSRVFYAQVGQYTNLTLNLGSTMEENPTFGEQEITQTYAAVVPFTNNGTSSSVTLSGQLTIPDNARDVTLTMTGPGGGFVFASTDSLKIGGQSWNLDKANLGKTFSQAGVLNYHASSTPSDGVWDGPNLDGAVSGFVVSDGTSGKISLIGVPKGQNMDITINLAQIYNTAQTFTLELRYKIEAQTGTTQEPVKNTFAGIQPLGENPGFEVEAVGDPIGQNKVNLKYRSQGPGVKIFTVNMNVGSGETTEPVQITVYNYEVKDYVYVLDYGLPVYLTGNGTQGQSIQSYSGATLLREDAQDVLHFFGVSNRKNNQDGAADAEDYQASGYRSAAGEGISFPNGTVTSTFEEVSSTDQTILYTPTRFMDQPDVFYYGVQVQENGTEPGETLDSTNATPVMEGEIAVVPASVVYYEDNFAGSGTEADGDNGIQYGGEHGTVGDSADGRVQSNDLNLRYGYDEVYAGDDGYSGGSATEMKAGSYAMFQFKGTGVDIISSTADNTGTVYVYVYDNAVIGENGAIQGAGSATYPVLKKVRIVNTYYENNGTTGLYQIPVVNIRDLDAGVNHVVKIVVSSVGKKNPVYLDGLRIYNPMVNGDKYYNTSELNTSVLELRDMILGDGYKVSYDSEGNATLTTEGKNIQASLVRFDSGSNTYLTGATVTENFTGAYYGGQESKDPSMTANMVSYLTQGPNNEVYLSPGYGVAFYVSGMTEAGSTLQIGAKKLLGSPTLQYRNAQGNWVALDTGRNGSVNTATEMYYEIPLSNCTVDNGKYLVVLRAGDGTAQDMPQDVISLTYLKASQNLAFTSVKAQGSVVVDAAIDAAGIEPVKEPGANHRRTVTFATDSDVLDVKVYRDGQEVNFTAASYVFSEAGTKTWLVTYEAQDAGTYSLKLIRATGESSGILNQ